MTITTTSLGCATGTKPAPAPADRADRSAVAPAGLWAGGATHAARATPLAKTRAAHWSWRGCRAAPGPIFQPPLLHVPKHPSPAYPLPQHTNIPGKFEEVQIGQS